MRRCVKTVDMEQVEQLAKQKYRQYCEERDLEPEDEAQIEAWAQNRPL